MSYGDDMVPAGTAHDPRAPWNEGDPDPLVCDTCGYENECDEQPGDPCTVTFDKHLGTVCHPDLDRAEPCGGKYVSARCDTCGRLSCDCD